MGWQECFMVQRGGEGWPISSGCNRDYQSSNLSEWHKTWQAAATWHILYIEVKKLALFCIFSIFLPFPHIWKSRNHKLQIWKKICKKKSKLSQFQPFLHKIKATVLVLHVMHGDFCLCASFVMKYHSLKLQDFKHLQDNNVVEGNICFWLVSFYKSCVQHLTIKL